MFMNMMETQARTERTPQTSYGRGSTRLDHSTKTILAWVVTARNASNTYTACALLDPEMQLSRPLQLECTLAVICSELTPFQILLCRSDDVVQVGRGCMC